MEEVPKIVRERLRKTAKVESHPDANLLAGFAEKSLTPREQAQVLEHLAVCAECREVVAVAAPEMEVMVAAAAGATRAAAAPAYAATPNVARTKWPLMRWVTVAACVVVVAGAAFLLRSKTPVATQRATTEAPKVQTVPQPKSETETKVEAKLQPAAPIISLDREKSELQKVAVARKTGDELRRQELSRNGNGFTGLTASPAVSPPPPPPPAVAGQASSGPGVSAGAGGGLAVSAIAKADEAKKKEEALADKVSMESDANLPRSTSENVEVSSANEMVTVEAAPVQLAQVEPAPAKAAGAPTAERAKRADKDSKQPSDTYGWSAGRAAGAAEVGSFAANLKLPFVKWTISSDGKLLRSVDDGKTWQPAALSPAEILRALSVNGTELWAGGVHGALYYSSDSGTSWQQIRPMAGGQVLTSDIVRIGSSAPKSGVVTTSDKQTWTTVDAGQTWQRKK